MNVTFHLMVVSAQVEALCYSVILEKPPEHAGIRCVARALTNISDGEGKSPNDVVRPESAVCHCHILARVLSWSCCCRSCCRHNVPPSCRANC